MSTKNGNVTKVVVVGMQGTGKTSIIKRYTWNQFNLYEQATLGPQNNVKQVKYTMSRKVYLRIWDVAGQDRYKSITKNFVRNSLGCVVVCDCENEESMKEAVIWKDLIQHESEYGENIPIILAQNKYDLLPNVIQESQSDETFGTEKFLKKFAEDNHFTDYIQVSALDGHQVEELFRSLIDHIIKFQGEDCLYSSSQMDDNSISLSHYESQLTKTTSVSNKRKSKCC